MKIHDLYGVNPAGKPEKQSSVKNVRGRKSEEKDGKPISAFAKSDQVEISQEAHELQKSNDEMSKARDLLSKTPSARSDVISEALTKLKAGLYSNEKIAYEAAAKLLQSGELNDLV